MSAVEVIGFLAAIAFFAISVIRNVVKQQQQESEHAQQKAKEEAHKHPAPPTHKPVVKKKVTKERLFVEELKTEQKPLRVQKKKACLPSGCTLRAAILSKEILDPPLALR